MQVYTALLQQWSQVMLQEPQLPYLMQNAKVFHISILPILISEILLIDFDTAIARQMYVLEDRMYLKAFTVLPLCLLSSKQAGRQASILSIVPAQVVSTAHQNSSSSSFRETTAVTALHISVLPLTFYHLVRL